MFPGLKTSDNPCAVRGRIKSNLFSSTFSLQCFSASYCIFVTYFLTRSPRTLHYQPYALVSCLRSHISLHCIVKLYLSSKAELKNHSAVKCLTSQVARMIFLLGPILLAACPDYNSHHALYFFNVLYCLLRFHVGYSFFFF